MATRDHSHHHHGHGDNEDDVLQCDHSRGVAHLHDKGIWDDDLMKKEEWDLDDWNEMYGKMAEKITKGRPSRELVKYVGRLLPSEPARVFVPLCGKSTDLRWLYDRGNTVVGLEGAERAVELFFHLHPDLNHSTQDLPFGKLYKSEDGRLQVYVCDVTQVPAGALGTFDAVFDWGAYTAIRPADRPRYAEVVTGTLKECGRYFLEVCHDGPSGGVGIPHSVPFRTIKLELGKGRKMEVLDTQDISAAWGVDVLFDSHILFSPLH